MITSISSESIRLAFGAIIAREREAAHFKQRPFARMTGISNSHLRSIESGAVSPTLVTICKIAAALEAEPSKLVEDACKLAAKPKELAKLRHAQ